MRTDVWWENLYENARLEDLNTDLRWINLGQDCVQ
jgi:hypothetical protein